MRLSEAKGEEMKRALLFVSIVGVTLFAYGDDGGRRFTVVLTGAEEAPGPGDPDGIGIAILRLNPGRSPTTESHASSGNSHIPTKTKCQIKAKPL